MALSDKDGATKIVNALKAAPNKEVREVIADKIVEKIQQVEKPKS